MDTTSTIDFLNRNGAAIIHLLESVDHDLASWKPSPDKWSSLEVASHLLDEERDDFRTRIRMTLEDPQQNWPRIDPQGWVTARQYDRRELADVVYELRRERAASLDWLRSAPIDLEASHLHPDLGRMRVGDLLVSWAAHDLLHLRQLTRLQFQWLEQKCAPYATDYAGDW